MEKPIICTVCPRGCHVKVTMNGTDEAARKATCAVLRHVLIACVSSLAGVSFVGAAEYIWFYPRVMFAFFILLGVTLAAVKLAEESK